MPDALPAPDRPVSPLPSPRAWLDRLAPEPARVVPWDRAAGIGLRTAHILGFGLVLGGVAWEVDPMRLWPAILLTVLSGIALVVLELSKTLHWLFLGKGLAVLVKLALLVWLPFTGEAAPLLLGAVVVVGSVGAHLPSRFRHYSVLLRRPFRSQPKPTPPELTPGE